MACSIAGKSITTARRDGLAAGIGATGHEFCPHYRKSSRLIIKVWSGIAFEFNVWVEFVEVLIKSTSFNTILIRVILGWPLVIMAERG
jgi:hypothetical protein